MKLNNWKKSEKDGIILVNNILKIKIHLWKLVLILKKQLNKKLRIYI